MSSTQGHQPQDTERDARGRSGAPATWATWGLAQSELRAVGVQDGLSSHWTRTGDGIRVPAIGPKKTARRVRIVYAPDLGLRILNVYNTILKWALDEVHIGLGRFVQN